MIIVLPSAEHPGIPRQSDRFRPEYSNWLWIVRLDRGRPTGQN
jgi:hypothetical protein